MVLGKNPNRKIPRETTQKNNFLKSKQRAVYFLISLTGSALFLTCENSGADQKRDTTLFNIATENPTIVYACSDPQPAFSSLNTEGAILNQCASCHSGSTINGNTNVTSYSSLRSKTVPGNANISVLYRALLPGNIMAPYTNPSLNQTIYCWVQGGANP